ATPPGGLLVGDRDADLRDAGRQPVANDVVRRADARESLRATEGGHGHVGSGAGRGGMRAPNNRASKVRSRRADSSISVSSRASASAGRAASYARQAASSSQIHRPMPVSGSPDSVARSRPIRPGTSGRGASDGADPSPRPA